MKAFILVGRSFECFNTQGNATIAGLENDLNLRGYDFNFAATCFSVAYAGLISGITYYISRWYCHAELAPGDLGSWGSCC